MDTEDQRDVELSTLSAIFPEIQTLDDGDPYTFALDVAVNPSEPVKVFFPAATEAQSLDITPPQKSEKTAIIDSHELSHLPAVRLAFSLPPSYPVDKPPSITVSTSPSWLPLDTVKKLEDDCMRMWEELGRDLVLFAYIDHIQQSAEDVFGLVSDRGQLEISPEHQIAVLDHDIKAKRRAFDKGTYDCGVCLDPKKGEKCHRMLDCGHVFCIQCLQDFYNNAIKEGDLVAVRCLEPSCAKKREDALKSGSKRVKAKTFISPSELLQIPLEPEVVKRYVTLKYKMELESDKNTIYCPRTWCQGAARSKKHKKPEGFELHEAEDSDIEDDQLDTAATKPAGPKKKPLRPEAVLAVCEDCNFAFCSGCHQSWHGEFYTCSLKRRNSNDLAKEEKASLEFLGLHTTPCPSCGSASQKTEGCNHMICPRCRTHFCYLCSSWLDPSNPYQHFNQPTNGPATSCHMRLWDLQDGDETGRNGFARGGAAQAEQPARQEDLETGVALENAMVGNIGQAEGVGEGVANRNVELGREADFGADGGRIIVAQEGPLVLRLDVGIAPRPHGDRAAPQEQQRGAAAPPAARQQRQRADGPHRNHGNARLAPQQQRGFGQRGRGGRGRGNGHRENHIQQPNQGPGLGRRQRQRQNNQQIPQEEAAGQQDELQDIDAAWIRHFVHLALEDNEDLIDFEDE